MLIGCQGQEIALEGGPLGLGLHDWNVVVLVPIPGGATEIRLYERLQNGIGPVFSLTVCVNQRVVLILVVIL